MIRESEFSRGYFVGGLGYNDNNMDTDRKRRVRYDGGEEEMGDGGGASGRRRRDHIEKTKKTQLGNNNPNKNIANPVDDSELSSSSVPSSSSTSSSSSSSPASSSSSPTAWKGVQGEWYGDRIEILVGSGDVYLQFEDENEDDDPFFRNRGLKKDVGFWKKFFYYPGFFLL